MRPPRNLPVLLGVIAVGSAAAFGWLGWEMLRQDAAAEAQREQERLGHEADRAAQAMDRLISDVETQPEAAPDGLIVTFRAGLIEAWPADRLLYYPSLPARPEASSELFADGEAAEYGDREPTRAVELYRLRANSKDATIRAAALMRIGRVLRQSGDVAGALDVYRELAKVPDAPLLGAPAELVARHAELDLLTQLGRADEARRVAQELVDGLGVGRWKITREQYEHYVDAPSRVANAAAPPGVLLATAQAVSDLWLEWQARPALQGRRLYRADRQTVLVTCRGNADRLVAWVVDPERVAAAARANGVALALADTSGAIIAGVTPDRTRPYVARTSTESELPWTIHVTAAGSRPDASGLTRGKLVVASLALMLLFLIAGSYVVGRAVKQEMDLARLQSDFVSAVSHEFRTPLAAMRQLSELLAAGRVSTDERRQQYYDSLAAESRRLQRLVESLLNFGRLEAGAQPYALEPLDPRELVEQVVTEFRSQLAQPDCHIELGGEEPVTPMFADRHAISLALHNLVDNAVKYSGRGAHIRVRWRRDGDRIALSVQDNGPGIRPDERGRIFEKFVRGAAAATHNIHGTGVGLAMVKLVVTDHGGEVVVDSEPGAGSTFTMLLPVSTTT